MTSAELERQIAAIASLHDSTRRRLYRYVAERRGEVGRDEAARALRISRALAAFHLDKLVAQGLLEASYRRLTARRGPGAGRPAKLYRRSSHQITLALPARRYELAAGVLLRALATVGTSAARRALERGARAQGRALGAGARGRAPDHAPAARRLATALAVLDECGYEPRRVGDQVKLANCPFRALAERSSSLVCGMNLALVRGVMAGAGAAGVRAELRPAPGSCCVVLTVAGQRTR